MKFKRLFKILVSLYTMLFILINISGCEKGFDMGFSNRADAYIKALNNLTTDGRINGHVFVAGNDEILLNKGYGYGDYDNKTEITEDTVFLIGSNTKLITSIAIMQLYQKGSLDIKDKVSKYVPDQTRGDEITIEHLLTHTSGIKKDVVLEFNRYMPKEELINRIASEPLQFEPGTSYLYSNAGYGLLAYIIEKASGQSYEEYLEENIFEPLDMNSTGAASSNEQLPKMATGYSINNSKLHEVPSYEKFDLSIFFGGGNVYSTAGDLYKLDRALYTDKILSKDMIDSMLANRYGWGSLDVNGHKCVGHNGLLNNGYASTFFRFPDEGLVVIILMNVRNADNIGLNLQQVLSVMAMGGECKLPENKKRIFLSADKLNKFEGKYKLENGRVIAVKADGDGLVMEPAEIKEIKHFPYSDSEFYAEGSEYRKLKFISDKNGNISSIVIEECIIAIKGKKIE